jgi:hypothetical protein
VNGFASRLLARSQGLPLGQGYALLEPRPASRFDGRAGFAAEPSSNSGNGDEQQTSLEQEAVSEVRPTSSPTPFTPRGVAGTRATALWVQRRDETDKMAPPQQSATRTAQSHSARSLAESGTPPTRAQPTGVVSTEKGDGAATPTSAWNGLSVEENSQPTGAETQDVKHSKAVVMRASLDIADTHIADQLARGATPDVTSAAKPMQETRQSVQPSISIGKIEVQFLPREPQPAPPPLALRTRGFEGYARARRGERH